mmetsp:Transcript_16082/g.26322  ORF Transcript_16082/g.26322 Transcript_16082/m.26322 type:complete len:101 (-) Transcript_16082:530-832(-)
MSATNRPFVHETVSLFADFESLFPTLVCLRNTATLASSSSSSFGLRWKWGCLGCRADGCLLWGCLEASQTRNGREGRGEVVRDVCVDVDTELVGKLLGLL